MVFANQGGSFCLAGKEAVFFQKDFKEIRSFGMIALSLVGDAEKIGLDEHELTAHVKELFKTYFVGIAYDDVSKNSKKFWDLVSTRDKKVGNITFRVWVVGDDFPVAYHIKCDAGNFDNPAIWTDEILGHGSKKTAPGAIREILDEMVRDLAANFFKARAQAM